MAVFAVAALAVLLAVGQGAAKPGGKAKPSVSTAASNANPAPNPTKRWHMGHNSRLHSAREKHKFNFKAWERRSQLANNTRAHFSKRSFS